MFSTRRSDLSWPLLAMATLTLTAWAPGQETPDQALRTLQQGNERFAADRSVAQPIGEGVRRTLARGQSPLAVVVTCADSRVPPEHLFNAGLGELIVVRVAGHVVSPESIASIERAVAQLNVPLCVVLGHEQCDVVGAAVAETDNRSHQSRRSPALTQLLERIEPAVRKVRQRDLGGRQLLAACEEEHAQATVQECLRRSALLRRFASVGKFRMVAARYHLDGKVEWLPNRPLPNEPETDTVIATGVLPPGLPPHVAFRLLRSGHLRFLGDSRPPADLTAARRSTLAAGQQPLAIVVTDCDSRVSPELIFDAGIGELYVVRTAGNTMTDDTLASIEFAAGELGASLLVVMGQSQCGPIAAAADHPENQQLTPNERALLRRLEPSVAASRGPAGEHLMARAAKANARRALQEARSRSPLLRTLEQEGRFAMLAGYYEVSSGDLTWLQEKAGAVAAKNDQHSDPAQQRASAHTGPAATGHGSSPDRAPEHGSTTAVYDAVPFLDWPPAAPMAEVDTFGHGGEPPSGSHEDHANTDASAANPQAQQHDEQAPTGSHGHPHAKANVNEGDDGPHVVPTHASRWTDPIVVVGMVGIASLLLAAVVAMRSRT